jgi:hypothetical protein
VYEDEPEVDHIERARSPWQRFSQDIELLELKVRWDWAMIGVEKSYSLEIPPRTDRATIKPMSTAVT